MKKVVVTGKTVDEAALMGAKELELSLEQVDIKVLEEGGKGLFGFGSKGVTVEVAESERSVAEEFLNDLFNKMGILCDIQCEAREYGTHVSLSSKDEKYILGDGAATLDAIQYIVNLVVNKGRGDRDFRRITLDVGEYREKREKGITHLAKSAASRVLRSGQPTELPPLNSYERHLVHEVLQKIEGIASHSEGEEPNRRVVISKIGSE